MNPQLAFVADGAATEAKPEQQADQGAVALAECDQLITKHAVAGEHVDAAGRNATVDQVAVDGPEQLRSDAAAERILARVSRADEDVLLVAHEPEEKLHCQFGRFLQIGRHHRKVVAARRDEASADRSERAEVARVTYQLRGESGLR